jgi:hypothetical protein
MESVGKLMVVAGLALAALGGLFMLGSRVPWLRFGRLPGDIAVERPGFGLYFPIATMILLSIVLTLVMWLFNMWRR